MKRLPPAERAWLGLGLYVLAADVYLWRSENDTLSIQFGRWLETKQGRALCFLCTAGMLAHLFWKVPLPFQSRFKKVAIIKVRRPLPRTPFPDPWKL